MITIKRHFIILAIDCIKRMSQDYIDSLKLDSCYLYPLIYFNSICYDDMFMKY